MTRGLPVTQVVCRMTLQNILVNAVGFDVVYNKSNVVDFKEDSDKVDFFNWPLFLSCIMVLGNMGDACLQLAYFLWKGMGFDKLGKNVRSVGYTAKEWKVNLSKIVPSTPPAPHMKMNSCICGKIC